MRRCIIGLFDGTPDGNDLGLEGTTHFGLDVDEFSYLDDAATIYWGEAATDIDTEQTEIHYTHYTITRESVPTSETVATEFFADVDAGFCTVDSSDGTFLFDHLGLAHGTRVERAELDLDAWQYDLAHMDQSRCWQLGWDRPDQEDVGVAFHDGADFDLNRDVTQLGFEYLWNGSVVRGTAAESGYVAVFSGVSRPAALGRWLREEILPHASIPEDDDADGAQATLEGA